MSTVQVRSHQVRVGKLADDIVAGTFGRKLMVLDCTPGGGKTGSAATLAIRLLDAGHIDRVLWVVPRVSLGEQVQAAFEWWPAAVVRAREAAEAVGPVAGSRRDHRKKVDAAIRAAMGKTVPSTVELAKRLWNRMSASERAEFVAFIDRE